MQHDGCRWHVSTGFVALVESAEDHPGIAGMVDSWSRHEERTNRSNPISKASALLLKSGYRRVADTHYHRMRRGLGLRAANEEIELLERAVRLITQKDASEPIV